MEPRDRDTGAKMRDYARFDRFLNSITTEVYPEPPSEPHASITRSTIEMLHKEGKIKTGDRVLDVGCGQGPALELFQQLGLRATGITLGSDLDVCRAKGFDVRAMDQNFMEFADGAFDVLWCRHVLEHSVAPYFTLTEYCRVTKPGGLIYVEVPAMDTSAHHELGANHYSILPSSSWRNLMGRTGCAIELAFNIDFTVDCGPDTYWSFLLRTPSGG